VQVSQTIQPLAKTIQLLWQGFAMHQRPVDSSRDSARRVLTLQLVAVAICAGLMAAMNPHVALADRSALWTITHDKCVPDQESHQNPAPCETVDLKGGEQQGYVILKDIRGATQFLLIPTRRISGIESPEILTPDLPNYWEKAWQARRFVEERVKHSLAWNMIGLAINSSVDRSQDQLHIHIDCINPEVRNTLIRHAGEIGPTWAALPFDLAGKRYSARRLDTAELETQDPFKILAASLPDAGRDMPLETLAVVGIDFPGDRKGFVLLAAHADPAKSVAAHSEDLLDHSCAVARHE
jgi:CDP-diacylglycerol pyrophosphatase